MSERVPQFETKGPLPGEAAAAGAAIWRMRVKQTPFDDNGKLARCRLVTGNAEIEGKRDYIVRIITPQSAGSVILVFAPLGGTDEVYNAAVVALQELVQPIGSLLGITVCHGPHGEEDFDDNWQWVRVQEITAECDPKEKWTLRDADDVDEFCPPDEGSGSGSGSGSTTREKIPFIVAACNVGNDTSKIHEQPGKLVVLTPLVGRTTSSGLVQRWACEFIDPTDNNQHCSSSSSAPSSSSPSSSSPSSSSPSSSSPSSSPGSDKSTAIVPASWSPTGYTALFVAEMPEVRFDDVITATVRQRNCRLAIDPKFIEVCEPGSLEVCGCTSDLPLAIGASIKGDKVWIRFSRPAKRNVRLVVRLTGIRKGFAGMRFPDRTREQFEANERFIRSAYPGGK